MTNEVVLFSDLIEAFDGGTRSVVGPLSTASIFSSSPHENITKTTGFFDIVGIHEDNFGKRNLLSE